MTIKEWYTTEYPTDDMGEELDEAISFYGVYEAILCGLDIYRVLGVGDSIVRERVFLELSEMLECDYNEIYTTWLKKQL